MTRFRRSDTYLTPPRHASQILRTGNTLETLGKALYSHILRDMRHTFTPHPLRHTSQNLEIGNT
nr:MAG TPA: hypothetical protein [Caudoviricetes sp.]